MDIQIETELEHVDEDVVEVVRQAAAAALTALNASDAELSVLICDDDRIHELNREWRGVDEPTDVLSFPLEEKTEAEPGRELAEGEPRLLGDIVLSLPRARAQADEYGHSWQRELAFLVVHGTLHLLGYDHEDEDERAEMRAQEEAILAGMGLDRTSAP